MEYRGIPRSLERPPTSDPELLERTSVDVSSVTEALPFGIVGAGFQSAPERLHLD